MITKRSALTAGGHTFGKVHGAAPDSHVGPEPEGAPMEQQGLGWKNSYGKGKGRDNHYLGPGRVVDADPDPVGHELFRRVVQIRMGVDQEPGWCSVSGYRKGLAEEDKAPDVEDPSIRVGIMMSTADMAMREDPEYRKISEHFHKNPEEFADAFTRAWFKLTHRDMGPKVRYLGPEVPDEDLIWQDPVPPVDHELINDQDIASLKDSILASGLSVSELVSTAWCSASTFRGSDNRGGANGARIRLAPQKDWEAFEPQKLSRVLGVLEGVQKQFNDAQSGNKRVSLADLIVLGGAGRGGKGGPGCRP